jgi:hypothetical protein
VGKNNIVIQKNFYQENFVNMKTIRMCTMYLEDGDVVGLGSQEDDGLSVSVDLVEPGPLLSQLVESTDLAIGRSCGQRSVRVVVRSANIRSPREIKSHDFFKDDT